ncbi:MAG: hypothetical protein JWP11_1168 [Frankiales bacterium]|nr:hypothetical protein [Frankiales bacterium]
MENVTRRAALLGGVGVIGGGAVAYVLRDDARATPRHRAAAVRGLAKPPAHLEHLLRSHFAAGVGTAVLVRQFAHAHRLRLVAIVDVQNATVAERQFNLLFAPLGGAKVAEGIYEVSGARIPNSTLFLSPVGRRGKDQRLQALINSPT